MNVFINYEYFLWLYEQFQALLKMLNFIKFCFVFVRQEESFMW